MHGGEGMEPSRRGTLGELSGSQEADSHSPRYVPPRPLDQLNNFSARQTLALIVKSQGQHSLHGEKHRIFAILNDYLSDSVIFAGGGVKRQAQGLPILSLSPVPSLPGPLPLPSFQPS